MKYFSKIPCLTLTVGRQKFVKYTYLSNKRRVANNRRVWKQYLNLINEGSGTKRGPGTLVTLFKKAFENSPFFNVFNDFFKNK